MLCRKLALIGVGLLGGSLGLAARQRRLAGEVAGFVRREASRAECLKAGAVDVATLDLAVAARDADLVVLCTPIGQMRELAARLAPLLSRGAVVTDVGSVKAGVVAEVEPLLGAAGAFFVGSHPMAGAEKMGVAHARPDLFDGAVCVVTPSATIPREAVSRVEALWQGVGARVLHLAPGQHDDLVARSSHLPQVLATALANYVLDEALPPEQAQLCAGGFRDGTRIASGSPEMWRDILLANRVPIAAALREFLGKLEGIRTAIEQGDAPAISRWLADGKRRRDGWLNQRKNNPSE
ncbi:MAG: prephenate dehydrogenase/arogenate dehydrogenase family protein [Verrucomicrobia bacterium]|nr:prephenate dehydrogenase/arogenate dehydrogenase family protein [Verrucomicrobiota bacterium]